MKVFEALPGIALGALLLLAYAACLSGCVRIDRDPPDAHSIDPGAFSVPVTTFAVVPF
jgi:hypothetical protein